MCRYSYFLHSASTRVGRVFPSPFSRFALPLSPSISYVDSRFRSFAFLCSIPLALRPTIAPRGVARRRCLPVVAAASTAQGKDAESKMTKSVEKVQEDFGTLRTGRADPKMLDRIMVDYYGTPTPMSGVAGVSVPDSSSLVIQPYDVSALKEIEKAIVSSDLGITPNNDGKVVRLVIPPLTEERRKELGKQAAKMGEEGKVAVRNIRRDVIKAAKDKANPIGEDEKKNIEKDVDKVTEDKVKEIDTMVKNKQKELTKV